MRKSSLALAALAAMGTVVLTPEPASAYHWGGWGGPGWHGGWGWRHHGGWGWRRSGWGVGAGLAGFGVGLLTGAALASPGYGYYGYPAYGYSTYPVTTTRVVYAAPAATQVVYVRPRRVRRVVYAAPVTTRVVYARPRVVTRVVYR